MKTVTIPTSMNPYVVTINNHTYSYPAGETVEVPDEVAAVIEDQEGLKPKHSKFSGHKIDLIVDAGNRTVECKIPISKLLQRVQEEGFECVNVKFYMYGNPIAVHKISASLPDLLRVHYMYLSSTGSTPTLSFDNVAVKADGTLSFTNEAKIVST